MCGSALNCTLPLTEESSPSTAQAPEGPWPQDPGAQAPEGPWGAGVLPVGPWSVRQAAQRSTLPVRELAASLQEKRAARWGTALALA